jgi:hypothetical protein
VTSVLLAFAQARASFDLVPVLIAAYVLYAVISGIARTVRRANAPRQTPSSTAPATAPMTVQQARATLAQRLGAQLAAQQRAIDAAQAQRSAPSAAASVPIAPAMPTDLSMGMPTLTVDLPAQASTQSTDFRSTLQLPPAALAIVARVVIGPCAAHAGAGHNPEDW